jgi:hypothetical protein
MLTQSLNPELTVRIVLNEQRETGHRAVLRAEQLRSFRRTRGSRRLR